MHEFIKQKNDLIYICRTEITGQDQGEGSMGCETTSTSRFGSQINKEEVWTWGYNQAGPAAKISP